MTDKQAWEDKLRARMDAWNAEIDRLRAMADEAGADARIEYQRQIDKLHQQQAQVQQQLDAYSKAGEAAWSDVRKGLEEAWEAMEAAMESARSRFR